VAPYIDGMGKVKKSACGQWLIIDRNGDINCGETNGLAMMGRYCPGLEDYVSRDEDFYNVWDLGERCSQTYIDQECFYCEGYDEYFTNDHGSVYLEDTNQTVSQRWADRSDCYEAPDGTWYATEPEEEEDEGPSAEELAA
jgi:hypothetical protein